MKDYEKAIEFYNKTIEVDPNYAEAYSNLGLIYCLQAQDFSEKLLLMSIIQNTKKTKLH